AGRDPTIMNGAIMKNFITPQVPFASAAVGSGDAFVSEVDESDGSIALFHPRIAVVSNISLDHKTMDELRALFRVVVAKAKTAVLNLDNDETKALAGSLTPEAVSTYSVVDPQAQLLARRIEPSPESIGFELSERVTGEQAAVELQMPGVHNVSNALAAV